MTLYGYISPYLVRHIVFVCTGFLCLVGEPQVDGEEVFTSFHVGNSLTWDMQAHAFDVRPLHDDQGYHIKGASSLTNIMQFAETYQESVPRYGPFPDALPGFEWDVVTLQPYVGPSASVEFQSFAEMANLTNGDARVLMYASWPDQRNITSTYTDAWYAEPPQGGYDDSVEMRHERAWYEHAVTEVRSLLPSRQVNLIPVGDVWAALGEVFRAGDYEGLSDEIDLYRDVRHANNVGRYAAHVTAWAVMHNKNPMNFPELQSAFWTASPGNHDNDVPPTSEVGSLVRRTVWEVVSNDPLTGVVSLPGDFNSDEVVNLADYTTWRDGLGGEYDADDYQVWKANYLPHRPGDFNRDGVVNLADYTVWRDGLGGRYGLGDYDVWKQNIGNGVSTPLATVTAVPEPVSNVVLVLCATMLIRFQSRHR